MIVYNVALVCHQGQKITEYNETRMRADAQRDGRPAEYRWRLL